MPRTQPGHLLSASLLCQREILSFQPVIEIHAAIELVSLRAHHLV